MKKKEENLKDIALLGSAIGNILQAINQAATQSEISEIKKILSQVKADKDFLEDKLKKWQKAYFELKDETNKLVKKITELQNEISNQQNEIYKLKKQLENKE